MKIGQIVKLVGLTHKGKNRVNEHGPLWEIRRIDNGMILVDSIVSQDWRWVHTTNDTNFQIKEISHDS